MQPVSPKTFRLTYKNYSWGVIVIGRGQSLGEVTLKLKNVSHVRRDIYRGVQSRDTQINL